MVVSSLLMVIAGGLLPAPSPQVVVNSNRVVSSVMLRVSDPATLIEQGMRTEDPASAFPVQLETLRSATVKVPGQPSVITHYHPFKKGQSMTATTLLEWYAKSTYLGAGERKPIVERNSSKRFLSRVFQTYSLKDGLRFIEVWVGPRGAWVFFDKPSTTEEPSTQGDESSFRKELILVEPMSSATLETEPSPLPDIVSTNADDTLIDDYLRYKGPPFRYTSLIDIFGGVALPLEGYLAVSHRYTETPGLMHLPLVVELFQSGLFKLDPLLKFISRDRGVTYFGSPKQSVYKIGNETGIRYEVSTKAGPGSWTTEVTAITKGYFAFVNVVIYRSDSPEWTRLAKEVVENCGPTDRAINRASISAPMQIPTFAASSSGVGESAAGTVKVPNDFVPQVVKIRGVEAKNSFFKTYGIEYELLGNDPEVNLTLLASEFEGRIQGKFNIERTDGDITEFLWGPPDPAKLPTFGERRERYFTAMGPDGTQKPGAYILVAYKSAKRVGVLIGVAENVATGYLPLRKWSHSVRWLLPSKQPPKKG